MSNVTKIVLPVLLIAGAAAGAYHLLNLADAPPITPEANESEQTTDSERNAAAQHAALRSTNASTAPVRVAVAGTAGNAHANAPQGVKGRVLLPNGAPAANVPVLLLESSSLNPIDIYVRKRAGLSSPPVASTATDQDGRFVLGVRKIDQEVDLRVASDRYPELSRSPITVRADEWVEAGELQLEQGLLVQGRVFDITTETPVAGATVYMDLASNEHAAATPGRERGVSTTCDAGGFFRFENGPRIGLINLTAEADGYASGKRTRQQLKTNAPNSFRIDVELGRQITGVVVDDTGGPIAGVELCAVGLSSKTPQTETVYSNDEGEFLFEAMREGPYRLTASARKHGQVENPLVVTGEAVTIVLPACGQVKLKVLTADNRAIKTYELSLKRTYPNNPDAIGNVFDVPDRRITPRNHRGGWAIIDGLPRGSYRFQLTARNHAKTLSPVFTIPEGIQEDIEVVAVLTEGGSITGTVLDDRGKPVQNALVTSAFNAGLAAHSGFFDIMRKMMPKQHTSKSTRTDRQGRFRIDQLSFADYMLRVQHDGYCEGTAIDIKVQAEGEVVDAGVVQLTKGTIVEGLTAVDGRPVGQVKVVVSMPTDPNSTVFHIDRATGPQVHISSTQAAAEDDKVTARRMFSASALSDGEGRFRMLHRIPPGTYRISAARHSRENPFDAIMDMKATEQELVLAPGQERAVVRFRLPGR